MGFLDKLASLLAPEVPLGSAHFPLQQAVPSAPTVETPAPPPPPEFAEIPAFLVKISATTAAEICNDCKLGPEAMQLLTPRQTPAQFLNLLQEKRLAADMVKVIAHGLPDREGVAWAVRSVERVADKLPLPDVNAMRAAQGWVMSPVAETREAAAVAAKRTDFQGPGAWSAQAAAWEGMKTQPKASAEEESPERLTPHAVSGSVQLASAIAVRAQLSAAKLPNGQMPSLGALPQATLPQLNVPNVSGAVARLQSGAATAAQLAALAEQGLTLPSAGAASLPNVPSAGSLPQFSAPTMPTLQSPTLNGPALQIPTIGTPSFPNPAASTPSMPGMPSIPDISMPQISTLTPEVQAKIFKEQHAFIALGIEIASGAIPVPVPVP